MTTNEPETWLGNIQKCCCEVGFDPVPYTSCRDCGASLPELTVMLSVVDGKLVKPLCRGCWEVRSVAARYCLRCGLPHAAGECKRGDR